MHSGGTLPGGTYQLGSTWEKSSAKSGGSSCIAAKATPVQLIEIRLANGLGGKGYFVMTGELPDVEDSLEAAAEFVKSKGMLAAREIIPSPHPDLIEKGVYW